MNPVDFLGNPITVKCKIAYPMRRGTKMWLQTMRVECVVRYGDGHMLLGYAAGGRRTRTHNCQNCIVLGKGRE